MEKAKILVCDINNAGVSKYRLKDPHVKLQELFMDSYHVTIRENVNLSVELVDGKFDIVVLQGNALINDKLYEVLVKIKAKGIKIIVDLDDYWHLPESHAFYHKMKDKYKKLVKRLNIADVVTTTTKKLAFEIQKFNKRISILPNAICFDEAQFIHKPIESDKVRIGWAGGSTHLSDMQSLRGVFNQFKISHKGKFQAIMAGFDDRIRNPETGEITISKTPKHWMKCEYVFSDGYRTGEVTYDANKARLVSDDKYDKYLLRISKNNFIGDADKYYYKRIWSMPIEEYATVYNEFDIVLAPLENNKFNQMKSPLKLLEAGAHSLPVVASPIYPYTSVIEDGKNSLLVKYHKNILKESKGWYNAIRKLVDSKAMREDLGMALNETVRENFDLNKVTEKRNRLYQHILNK